MKLEHGNVGRGEHRYFADGKHVATVQAVKGTSLFYPSIKLADGTTKDGNRLPTLEACVVWITHALNHEGHLKEQVEKA